MENLYSQQSQNNAEAVTKTHGESTTATQVAQVATEVVTVAAGVADTVSDASKNNETKAAEVTQIGAAVLESIPVISPFTPVIALGVDLEPEIYHGISALIHFFQSRHKAAKAAAAAAAQSK